MPGFSRRPLAFVVCCLFVGVQAAPVIAETADEDGATQDLALSSASTAATPEDLDDPGLTLRKERKFNILAKKKPTKDAAVPLPAELGIAASATSKQEDKYPLFIAADTIEGQNDEVAIAEGHVELRKIDALLFADRLTYRPLEDEVEATGSVRLQQDGGEFSMPHLRMKLSEQIGGGEDVTYHIVREVKNRFYEPQQMMVSIATSNANTSGAPMMLNVANSYGLPTVAPLLRTSEVNGHAERLNFEGENQISLFSSTLSSCKPDETDWYLRSATAHLDYDNNEGTAKDASLWLGDVPVLYTPSASFPLGGQRRSGILHPHFSASTRNGLDLTVPYYWYLAPNYDLTLLPRYLAKRGTQLGADARYVDYHYEGEMRFEYMPNDAMLGRSRYAYRFDHLQNLGQGVSALVNWQGVSDDFYWQDLSSRMLQTSAMQLPKQVLLSYAPSPWLQGNLQVLRYQTLQIDPANPIAQPYFLEPQLNLVGYKANVLKTDFSMVGQFSRFTHPDAGRVQGDRVVFYPQLSMPIVDPAFQITPKIGLHLTKYTLNNLVAGQPDSISRALPTFSVDSTVVFEREGDWFGKGYIQTLEPRLYYVNIPYRDQSQIPLFDTSLSDFNFSQIFSENRYSGYDRINDANQLTAGLTTRLIDGETGVERFKAMLGQRYYFKPQRVAITGEVARQSDFSNIVAAINGLVAPKTYMDLAWEYNYREATSERFAAGMRFQPELGKVLSASYRYTRDPLNTASTVDQIDMAGQWPLSGRWYAVGRYNYSMSDKRILEMIAGAEYNAGCWAFRAVVQRMGAIAGAPNDTLFLQLELSDFGSLGSNPVGLLRRTVPGYGKTNELPGSGSLLTTQ